MEQAAANPALCRLFGAVEAEAVRARVPLTPTLLAADAERAHHELALRRKNQTRPQALLRQEASRNEVGKQV